MCLHLLITFPSNLRVRRQHFVTSRDGKCVAKHGSWRRVSQWCLFKLNSHLQLSPATLLDEFRVWDCHVLSGLYAIFIPSVVLLDESTVLELVYIIFMCRNYGYPGELANFLWVAQALVFVCVVREQFVQRSIFQASV